jgi:hypothetical protein
MMTATAAVLYPPPPPPHPNPTLLSFVACPLARTAGLVEGGEGAERLYQAKITACSTLTRIKPVC